MTNELNSNSTQPNVPQEEKQTKGKKRQFQGEIRKFYEIRLIPIWLRIVLILVLLCFAIIIGLMIGYGVIGEGKPLDALKWGTYQHMIDMMSGKEQS